MPGGPGPRRDERGRVHLEVVVDENSGEEHLALAAPVFKEDWQNRMALATANTGFALLRQDPSASTASQLGRKSMEATSTLVGSLLSRAPAGAVACRAGCAHCCYQSVGATVPEVLAIFTHLVETRSLVELGSVQARVERAYHRTRGLTREQRNAPEYPCPFLEDNQCSIYEVRPLVCRGVHSLDEQVCADQLHDKERRAAHERGEVPGYSFVEPVRAVHAVSAGMQLGLSEGLGLDMRPLDLNAAMHLLLSEATAEGGQTANLGSNAVPSTANPHEGAGPLHLPTLASRRARQWLAGEPAFAEARGGDATDHKGQLELSGAVALAAQRRGQRRGGAGRD